MRRGRTAPEALHALAPLGPYRPFARLAKGGMAEVLLAEDLRERAEPAVVVVKTLTLDPSTDQELATRFSREAQLAVLLQHPNIVRTYGCGGAGDKFYIAMQYLEGASLAEVLAAMREREARLEPGLVCWIGACVAAALHHAHELRGASGELLGLVHRDVSPDNVFLTRSGEVKLIDFGVAKLRSDLISARTRTGLIIGKIPYMAPEHACGEPVDARSDVFSLGVVLWECLTGRPLFDQPDERALFKAIVEQDAPPPRSCRSDLPAAVDEVVRRALRRAPAARFTSAGEMASALREAMGSLTPERGSQELQQLVQGLFLELLDSRSAVISSRSVAASPGALLPATVKARRLGGPEEDPAALLRTTVKSQRGDGRARAPALWALGLACAGLGGLALALGLGSRGDAQRRDAGGHIEEPATAPPAPRPDAAAGVDRGPAERLAYAAPDAGVEDHGGARIQQQGVAPVPREPRARPHPRARQVRRAPPQRGTLRIMTEPWTVIYHGGKKLGQTPIAAVRLPAGRQRLRAVNRDAGIDVSFAVHIAPGQLTVVRKDFRISPE